VIIALQYAACIGTGAALERGREAAALGDQQAAESAWRQVLERRPDDAEAQRGLAVALLARDLPEEACGLLQQAEAADCWLSAAAQAADAGRPQRVVALVTRAVALPLPDAARAALLRLGVAAAEAAGREDLAQAWYPTLLGLDPANAKLHVGYARVLAAGGRLDEALRELELAVDLGEDPSLHAEALAALRAKRGAAAQRARFEDLPQSGQSNLPAPGAVSMEAWDGRAIVATIRIEETAPVVSTAPVRIERAIWPAGTAPADVLGQIAAYAAALACPSVRGEVLLTVGARGEVSDLQLSGAGPAECLTRTAAGWAFPAMVDGYLKVTFPLPWPGDRP
jgi:tetratricopeptide (TPR) repeat protein